MANQYGDYQTPTILTERVLKVLKSNNFDFQNVIEPTFGIGSFIESIPKIMDNTKVINGVEIQSEYYKEALSKRTKNIKYNLFNHDFFTFNLKTLFSDTYNNLVVGNLPWVTVSQLSSFDSKNIPKKANIKGLTGYDALTGKSNFDIAEYMSLSLLNIMNDLNGESVLALLVKKTVAKNIIKYLPSSNIKPSLFSIYTFDAKKEFNVSVDACLMIIGFNTESTFNNIVNEYSLYEPNKLVNKFGWFNNKFVSNIDNYKTSYLFDNETDWDWRSGVKHDASKVMELKRENDGWINGLKEYYHDYELASDYIYPLVKSSDVRKQDIHNSFRKYVIITQKKSKEDTLHIETDSPSTWKYLQEHKIWFEKRRSSIYKGSADFSIFGIGDYSFKPYKVAISGMYKEPFFAILPPKDEKPVMTDDTVYFVGFDSFVEANIFASVLNSKKTQRLLSSITFSDAKRPYTKDVLKRIDVVSILKSMKLEELNKTSFKYINDSDVIRFLDTYDTKLSLF